MIAENTYESKELLERLVQEEEGILDDVGGLALGAGGGVAAGAGGTAVASKLLKKKPAATTTATTAAKQTSKKATSKISQERLTDCKAAVLTLQPRHR